MLPAGSHGPARPRKDETTRPLPPLESWQVFHVAHKRLGMARVTRIWNKSPREIYRWAADPACCGDIRSNPIDLTQKTLKALTDIGLEAEARAAVRILADEVDCDLTPKRAPAPDKDTLLEEIVDDHPELAALYKAMTEGADVRTVAALRDRVVQEIDETVAKYAEEKQ